MPIKLPSGADLDLTALETVMNSGGTPGPQGPAGPSWQLPVGFVFTSMVNTDPATLLGYGTWTAIGTGRVLVGVDPADAAIDAPGKTTGAKTVAAAGTNAGAAVADHAAHTHAVTSNVAVADHPAGTTGAHSGSAQKIGTSTASAAPSPHTHSTPALVHSVTNNAVTSGNPSATLTHSVTQPTFTGSPTSVVQPSLAVYFFQRTA